MRSPSILRIIRPNPHPPGPDLQYKGGVRRFQHARDPGGRMASGESPGQEDCKVALVCPWTLTPALSQGERGTNSHSRSPWERAGVRVLVARSSDFAIVLVPRQLACQ